MHRLIMDAQERQEIDHADGNGLNNQKDNLRFCTHSQNHMNRKPTKGSSKYKGVSWHKAAKKWNARITLNKKTVSIGYFDSEIIAAKAYDEKAIELFGEFAKLNKAG